MDARLSEEQVLLRDALRDRLEDRAISWVRESHSSRLPSPEMWTHCADSGLFAVLLPADDGGLGMTICDAAPLIEEAGRQLLPSLVVDTMLAAQCFSTHDPLLTLSRTPGATDVSSGAVRIGLWGFDALQDGKGLPRLDSTSAPRLSGVVYAGPFAEAADFALVRVTNAANGQQAVAMLPLSAHPVQGTLQPSLGFMDPLYRVDLAETDTSAVHVLGGDELASQLTRAYRLARCLEMVGAGARSLERSVAYAQERTTFGKPIGSNQAIKHMCADMLLTVETARSSTYYASWAVAGGTASSEAAHAVDIAESYCASRLPTIGTNGIQINGGMGYTWEFDSHLYLRRLKQHASLLSHRMARKRLISELKLRSREEAAHV